MCFAIKITPILIQFNLSTKCEMLTLCWQITHPAIKRYVK